jgi:8-oxo-dGTP pyrophosphatase MutT (NUDIX family)/GNAT superfamily N-acetyltransferase
MHEHTPRLELRPATPDDAADVLRIYVDSWNAGFGALMPRIEVDPARVLSWRRALAEPPPARWWVAERDHVIVGFIGIRPSRDPIDSTLGEVDTIAVDPPAWRTGVGRALMSAALRALCADGYRSAALWTLSGYPRGASFYEATGWRLHGATRDDGRQVRCDHDLSPSARRCSVALFVRDGKLLLGRRSPTKSFYPGVWDLIGGHALPEESPEEALRREVEEEVGSIPTEFSLLEIAPEPNPEAHGPCDYHLFLVRGWTGPDPFLKNPEHVELGWFTPREARELNLADPAYLELLARVEALPEFGAA